MASSISTSASSSRLVARKTKLDETIAGLKRERAKLEARLGKEISQDKITEIVTFARDLSKGLAKADKRFATRRAIIEMLDVHGILAVEDEEKVVYASFVLCTEGEKLKLSDYANHYKIAFATEDGKTISAHFGKAPYYAVVEVSEGKVVTQEVRAKTYHGNHQEYGHDHADMFTCIADCQVLVVGGMGTPAHEAALAHGLQVVPADPRDISAVIQAYLDGTLQENPRLIHRHGGAHRNTRCCAQASVRLHPRG